MTFPNSIIAGDSFTYTVNNPTYTSPTWSLILALRGATSFNKTSTPNPDGSHIFKLSPSETAQFTAGAVAFVIIATDGTDEFSIESGTTEVKLRADLITTSDVRNQYKRIVDAIDATLENRATSDQSSYTIAGRSLSRIPIAELLSLRKMYVELAARADARANGNKQRTTLVVRPL